VVFGLIWFDFFLIKSKLKKEKEKKIFRKKVMSDVDSEAELARGRVREMRTYFEKESKELEVKAKALKSGGRSKSSNRLQQMQMQKARPQSLIMATSASVQGLDRVSKIHATGSEACLLDRVKKQKKKQETSEANDCNVPASRLSASEHAPTNVEQSTKVAKDEPKEAEKEQAKEVEKDEPKEVEKTKKEKAKKAKEVSKEKIEVTKEKNVVPDDEKLLSPPSRRRRKKRSKTAGFVDLAASVPAISTRAVEPLSPRAESPVSGKKALSSRRRRNRSRGEETSPVQPLKLSRNRSRDAFDAVALRDLIAERDAKLFAALEEAQEEQMRQTRLSFAQLNAKVDALGTRLDRALSSPRASPARDRSDSSLAAVAQLRSAAAAVSVDALDIKLKLPSGLQANGDSSDRDDAAIVVDDDDDDEDDVRHESSSNVSPPSPSSVDKQAATVAASSSSSLSSSLPKLPSPSAAVASPRGLGTSFHVLSSGLERGTLDPQTVRRMLDDLGDDVLMRRCSNGSTLLHCAVAGSREGVVECLLEAADKRGVLINLLCTPNSSTGLPPLHMACQSAEVSVQAVKQLIGGIFVHVDEAAQSQVVNAKCVTKGGSVLHYLASRKVPRGGEKMVEGVARMLVGAIDVNVRDFLNATPLHWAAEAHSAHFVDLLLKADADPFAESQSGLTPLNLALQCNAPKQVIELLDRGKKGASGKKGGGGGGFFATIGRSRTKHKKRELSKDIVGRSSSPLAMSSSSPKSGRHAAKSAGTPPSPSSSLTSIGANSSASMPSVSARRRLGDGGRFAFPQQSIRQLRDLAQLTAQSSSNSLLADSQGGDNAAKGDSTSPRSAASGGDSGRGDAWSSASAVSFADARRQHSAPSANSGAASSSTASPSSPRDSADDSVDHSDSLPRGLPAAPVAAVRMRAARNDLSAMLLRRSSMDAATARGLINAPWHGVSLFDLIPGGWKDEAVPAPLALMLASLSSATHDEITNPLSRDDEKALRRIVGSNQRRDVLVALRGRSKRSPAFAWALLKHFFMSLPSPIIEPRLVADIHRAASLGRDDLERKARASVFFKLEPHARQLLRHGAERLLQRADHVDTVVPFARLLLQADDEDPVVRDYVLYLVTHQRELFALNHASVRYFLVRGKRLVGHATVDMALLKLIDIDYRELEPAYAEMAVLLCEYFVGERQLLEFLTSSYLDSPNLHVAVKRCIASTLRLWIKRCHAELASNHEWLELLCDFVEQARRQLGMHVSKASSSDDDDDHKSGGDGNDDNVDDNEQDDEQALRKLVRFLDNYCSGKRAAPHCGYLPASRHVQLFPDGALSANAKAHDIADVEARLSLRRGKQAMLTPEQLALHIAAIDFDLLVHVPTRELRRMRFADEQTMYEQAPCWTRWRVFAQSLYDWSSDVMARHTRSGTKLNKRIVTFFMQLAVALHNLNDFNGAWQIMMAIFMLPRSPQTIHEWSKKEDKYRPVLDAFVQTSCVYGMGTDMELKGLQRHMDFAARDFRPAVPVPGIIGGQLGKLDFEIFGKFPVPTVEDQEKERRGGLEHDNSSNDDDGDDEEKEKQSRSSRSESASGSTSASSLSSSSHGAVAAPVPPSPASDVELVKMVHIHKLRLIAQVIHKFLFFQRNALSHQIEFPDDHEEDPLLYGFLLRLSSIYKA
jgi:Ankyrin repeats (3 copies)/RasGEF domain